MMNSCLKAPTTYIHAHYYKKCMCAVYAIDVLIENFLVTAKLIKINARTTVHVVLFVFGYTFLRDPTRTVFWESQLSMSDVSLTGVAISMLPTNDQ